MKFLTTLLRLQATSDGDSLPYTVNGLNDDTIAKSYHQLVPIEDGRKIDRSLLQLARRS